jgi:hypothetical protein
MSKTQFTASRTSPAKFLIFVSLLALLYRVVGCDSSGTGQGLKANDYTLRGIAVIDPNLDSTRVSAVGTRNDTIVSTLLLALGNATLSYDDTLFAIDSSWYFADDTARHFLPGTYSVIFEDNSFSRSFPQTVPDTFSITSVAPANRLIQGNGPAQIEWTAKSGYTSYVVAVIKQDSAFTGKGWCAYADNFANAANIPPNAFLGSDGLNPDTGLYNLYVYGIVGSPDSVLAFGILPVALPSQLADNISQQRLIGRIGVVVVSLLDTIRVVQQP